MVIVKSNLVELRVKMYNSSAAHCASHPAFCASMKFSSVVINSQYPMQYVDEVPAMPMTFDNGTYPRQCILTLLGGNWPTSGNLSSLSIYSFYCFRDWKHIQVFLLAFWKTKRKSCVQTEASFRRMQTDRKIFYRMERIQKEPSCTFQLR